eukprot:2416401-Rhodomonas_salina.2
MGEQPRYVTRNNMLVGAISISQQRWVPYRRLSPNKLPTYPPTSFLRTVRYCHTGLLRAVRY